MAEDGDVKVINNEFIGSADSQHTTFSGHLLEHKPIVPGTVEFFLGDRKIAEDDSNGTLEGSGLNEDAANVIDYETQDYNIEVDSGFISGEERITVSYSVAEEADSLDALQEIRSNVDQEEVSVPYELADENVVDRLISRDLSAAQVRQMLEERVIGETNVDNQLQDLADQFFNGS